MDLKDAFSKLKSHRNQPLHFFFCEKGQDGKPLLVVDKNKIPDTERKKVLATAKSKETYCGGEMELSPDDVLTVTPIGKHSVNALTLRTSLTKITHDNHLTPREIRIGDAKADLTETPAAPVKGRLDRAELERLKSYSLKNKHPDVFQYMKDDPEMKRLTQEREAACSKLNDLFTGQDYPGKELEIAAAQKHVKSLDEQIENLTKKFIAQGVVPKALGAEYARENERMGWRCGGGKEIPDPIPGQTKEVREQQIEDYQKIRESKLATTRYNNEAEQKAAEVKFKDAFEDDKAVGATKVNADGTVGGKVGTLSGEKDYVIDTAGQMYQGKPTARFVGQAEAPVAGTNPFSKEPMVAGDMTSQAQFSHHSSILAGKPVRGAGEIKFDADGNIVRINNSSGHYKPGATQMIDTVEILVTAGALIDHTYRDANGIPLENLPDDNKAKKLYDATMRVQDKLVPKLENGENVDADKEMIKKAKDMLKKMGCGPGERFVRDTSKTVAFADVTGNMTGKDVKERLKQANANPVTAHEFLSTGGGNQAQADLKGQMHAELKDTLKAKAQRLDQAAEESVIDKLRRKLAEIEKQLSEISIKEAESEEGKARSEALRKVKGELEEQIAKLKKYIEEGKVKPDDVDDLTTLLENRLKELTGADGVQTISLDSPGLEGLDSYSAMSQDEIQQEGSSPSIVAPTYTTLPNPGPGEHDVGSSPSVVTPNYTDPSAT
jgi:hypothetical protein